MVTFFIVLFFVSCGLWIPVSLALIKGWDRLDESTLKKGPFLLKVSVLIAARNEEKTISALLEDLMRQDYPANLLEIVVIDDHSEDQTSACVRAFGDRVKLLTLNEESILNSYKKKAITKAVAHSSGELIVTTDADCRVGPRWIRSLVSAYLEGNVRLISAPVVYHGERGGFQKVQSLEFMYLIGMGAACIRNGYPFTCNGANLAYDRRTFDEVGGFTGIDHLASGDDELLLHKVASKFPGSIKFVKSEDATVYTLAKENLKAFFQQRKRWASKSLRYRSVLPILFAFFLGLFYADTLFNLVLGFFKPIFFGFAIFQFVTKAMLDGVFLHQISLFFKRKKLLNYLLMLELAHTFYWLLMGILGNTGKYEWKERVVR